MTTEYEYKTPVLPEIKSEHGTGKDYFTLLNAKLA